MSRFAPGRSRLGGGLLLAALFAALALNPRPDLLRGLFERPAESVPASAMVPAAEEQDAPLEDSLPTGQNQRGQRRRGAATPDGCRRGPQLAARAAPELALCRPPFVRRDPYGNGLGAPRLC